MVTSSPLSACVICSAPAKGCARSGAIASPTSHVSPSTKRAASTWPSRNFAAMSPRAGVRRGSAIAFAQQLVERAGALAFAAFGTARLRRWRPGINVEMQPAPGMLDEALQEQRAGDRAGKAAGGRIGDGRDLGVEPAVVRRPQRHPPQRIVLPGGAGRYLLRQCLVIG